MRNDLFNDTIVVSRKQVELAIYLRNYRRMHELSQVEMAGLCSIYAEPYHVKITSQEISDFENYRKKPSRKKFQILLNTMDLNDI